MTTTFLVVKNEAISTLASGINDAVTSLDVAAGEGALFPSTYPFHISIDAEILSCTNRSTDTLTVVRAQQGTSAAAHLAAAAVELRVTAKNITDLNTAVNTLEGKMPDTTHPVTQAFGDVADEGAASTTARIDHKHGMPNAPALSSIIITSTRARNGNTADVAYTGVGFVPTVIIALAVLAGTEVSNSIGFSDSAKAAACIFTYYDGGSNGGGAFIAAVGGDGTAAPTTTGQTAIVKSYDADGFTLTWTKNGTPSAGTISLYFLCLK